MNKLFVENYLVKLAVSDKIVRQKANSSKNSSQKLFHQTPKLSFLLDQIANFNQKISFWSKSSSKSCLPNTSLVDSLDCCKKLMLLDVY